MNNHIYIGSVATGVCIEYSSRYSMVERNYQRIIIEKAITVNANNPE